MLHTKFQPNMLSHSGEKVDCIEADFLVSAAIFYSRPGGIIILKLCNLIILHVKFEIQRCSGFSKEVI